METGVCWRLALCSHRVAMASSLLTHKAHAAPCPHVPQRALLRTAQEIAKGMGYIHEFNIGGWGWR